MASKRPNKQQRQRQNRQQREARRARSARAGEATAVARGEKKPSAVAADSSRTTGKAGGAKAAPAKRRRPSYYTVPGQRAVVMAFAFTIVSAVMLLVSDVPHQVDADDPVLQEIDEDAIQERDEEEGTVRFDARLLEVQEPAVAAGVLLTPIAITGAAVWFAKRPQRSTVWTISLILMAGYVFFLAGPYVQLMIIPMIALAVGGFQSRRAESKERLAELRAKKAAAADGEVIDVESTEVDPSADEAARPVAEDDRR